MLCGGEKEQRRIGRKVFEEGKCLIRGPKNGEGKGGKMGKIVAVKTVGNRRL